MQHDRAGWRPGLVVALLPEALLLAANAGRETAGAAFTRPDSIMPAIGATTK